MLPGLDLRFHNMVKKQINSINIYNLRSLSHSQLIEEKRLVKLSPISQIRVDDQKKGIKYLKMIKFGRNRRARRGAEDDCSDKLTSSSSQDPTKNCAMFSRFCVTDDNIGQKVRAECKFTCKLC